MAIVVNNNVVEQHVENIKSMLEADKEVEAGKLLGSLVIMLLLDLVAKRGIGS